MTTKRTLGLPAVGRGAAAMALAILAVGACAPPAQQEATRIGDVAATDAPVIDACWRRLLISPAYQALKPKMGEYSDSPTAAMKINPQMATPQEVAQVLALRRDYVTACRRLALESAARVHPGIVAILAGNYAKVDANTARFATGQIAWGAFVSENQALVTERRGQLLAAGETMQRSVSQSAPPARERRQQAEASIESWTRQQQNLLPGQPVASCRYAGSRLACTTE